MKIEKITENKIRIIIKKEDFKDKSINLQKLVLNTAESHNLFLEILNKAEKEANFDIDGYKLLIETYLEGNDICIFTITKYRESSITNHKSKKYLTIKRKTQSLNSNSLIYKFYEFENFCDFCSFIHKNHNITLKGLFKTALLYNYNNTYYLVIDGINISHNSFHSFHSSLLEFSDLLKYDKNFKFKLKEHAKIIIKNNAINIGLKYFA